MLDNSEYLANEWLAEAALKGLLIIHKEQVVKTKPSFWERIKRFFQ